MLSVTKIFYFEMAHAIYGYSGPCKNVHGHSYELHVTVSNSFFGDDYIPAPGFVLGFKELKQLVQSSVLETLDHKIVLSDQFLANNNAMALQQNLLVWKAEPTAENILIYIQKILCEKLPSAIKLASLTLYETKSSYALWKNKDVFN